MTRTDLDFLVHNFLRRYFAACIASLSLTVQLINGFISNKFHIIVGCYNLSLADKQIIAVSVLGLFTTAFTTLLCEWRNVGRLQSFFLNVLTAASSSAASYFLMKRGLYDIYLFTCFVSFLLMFTVPMWGGTRSESHSHCFGFSMRKRMFESIVLACAFLCVAVPVALWIVSYSELLLDKRPHFWEVVIPLVFAFFCPIFTLYKVSKDNFCPNPDYVSHPHEPDAKRSYEKLVEQGFVYAMAFLAVVLTVCYLYAFSNILIAMMTPRQVHWADYPVVMALFAGSMIVYPIATPPTGQGKYAELRILRFFRKCFPWAWLILAAFGAIKLIGFQTLYCIEPRMPAVWLGWAIVMCLLGIRKQLDGHIAKITFIVANLSAGTLLYYEKQIEQIEPRVFAFLEKEGFIKDGVIQKKAKISDVVGFQLAKCNDWLKNNPDVAQSRLGKVVTDPDGKRYFVENTPTGEKRTDMTENDNLLSMFGGDWKSGYCGSMHIPLRFPFRGVIEGKSWWERVFRF
jgi:hypothetical protein